jgi:hypothetical protein
VVDASRRSGGSPFNGIATGIGSWVKAVDTTFFKTLGITKTWHMLLFARGIANL